MGEIKVPELAESISEGTLVQWLKKTGDSIQKGDYVAELETDKVNIEIISEYSGILSELKVRAGSTVTVGEVIAVVNEKHISNETQPETMDVDEHKEDPASIVHPMANFPAYEPTSASKKYLIVSPAARKLAREKGIDLSKVSPADPLGRIRLHDVQRYKQSDDIEHTANMAARETKTIITAEEKPVERIQMTRRRQTIARNLVEMKQKTAMLTTFNEIDMTNLLDLRSRRKQQFHEEYGVKLGFMSFFTKAAVAALKKSPLLNAEIQEAEIVVKKYYDIGIAVSTNGGLVVPVIREADRKNVAELEKEIYELAERARNNRLAISDLQGGTFTITNGGVFGSLLSTPMLNGPQAAILGMHSIQLRPVAVDEEKIENRRMMYVALTYDHRLIDGKEAVTFLKQIKTFIEDPESLLFT
ncbi:2-oxoglutarate dehydrogenase complex dihydrolipoyllysine-residue succinyltransferase [Niallia oryzisoli]|uniref:Dihydrolipoyllysine-residue succinyltransferase component of 2-oxoglutarate dehydrogenase complex n=1 Tax=Niallia oryzisoli TaxID=1737571 RepID=A0ABZ2CJT8_9BACI